ncbi:type 4a pilus biogenesis protein PilO [Candidatus Woesebacteria bacterium]|nr:type 4a pilus biogenesis protein PilO [Candidatus Woesebacteria bacterium]
MKKSLFGANVSAILIPSVYFLLSILLFVFGARTGIKRISEQRNALNEARKSQAVLEQKESLLKQIETEISSQVDVLANVLPEGNPALIMISQVKNLAAVSGITITMFKTGAQTDTGAVSFVNLSFDAEGELVSLISFLNTMKILAPLSTIEKVKINQQAGAASANISARIYFAEYPTKLPSLTEAVNELSAEEQGLLDTLSGLTLPVFTTLSPQGPSIRESPFN